MKKLLAAWFSALLIAALLLTPAAMMEEAQEAVIAAKIETPAANEAEEAADAVTSEAVDEAVTEASAALDEATEDAPDIMPAFEAQAAEEELGETGDYAVMEQTPGESTGLMEAAGEIPIDAAHFPDTEFRQYITDRYDSDKNGYLSVNERDLPLLSRQGEDTVFNHPLHTMIINLYNDHYYNIQSLAGIEYFNVQVLLFDTHSITELDMSNILLPDLGWLEIQPDQNLTSIKIGSKPKLEILLLKGYDDGSGWHASSNVSGDLDLTGCPSMRYADLGWFNNLKRISINPNSELNNLKFDRYDTEGNSIPLKKAPKIYRHKKYQYKWKGALYGLMCPHNTKLITNAYVPASGVDQIACTGKRAKATVNVGATFQINPGATAGKGFKSSKKKIATVSSNGIVTAKAAGKTNITFKVGKKQRTLVLTVADPTIPTSVTLSTDTTAVKAGDSVTLTPVIPEGTNTTFKWKSSNKKVAVVSNGVVTFKKPGKVTITATAVRGKKKAVLKFTVSK